VSKMSNGNLAHALHQRRRAKELTLKQLSELSGVSIAHLGRMERGERLPSGKTLGKLAGPLGFSEIGLLKLAGLLSPDETDGRVEMLKKRFRSTVADALVEILNQIDSL